MTWLAFACFAFVAPLALLGMPIVLGALLHAVHVPWAARPLLMAPPVIALYAGAYHLLLAWPWPETPPRAPLPIARARRARSRSSAA